MADKTATIERVKHGTSAPFLRTSFVVPDIDSGDTVAVPGLARVEHAIVTTTGATATAVQVNTIAGNVITFAGGDDTPVYVEAKGYR